MSVESMSSRPCIGMVVEGIGEYEAFPALVNKVLNVEGLHVPRVQTGGYGGITSHLSEHLDDLVLTHFPHNVVICVDLIDVLKARLYQSCSKLLGALNTEIAEWLRIRADNPRFRPLPQYVEVVLQVPKLESWLVASIGELLPCNSTPPGHKHKLGHDVDCDTIDPVEVLRAASSGRINTKDPSELRCLFSQCSVSQMESHSRSFRKFAKEVRNAYSRWSICVQLE